jgi:acetate kinase
LNFLGIELDKSRNAKTAAVISKHSSRVIVRVIRTDEELMIARSVLRSCLTMPKVGNRNCDSEL